VHAAKSSCWRCLLVLLHPVSPMSAKMEASNTGQATPAASTEKTQRTGAQLAPNEDGTGAPPATEDGIRPVTTAASSEEHAISLQEVDPVSVQLEHLSVSVDQSPNLFARLFSKDAGARDAEKSHVKTILDDISAEMSSGSLTAIIGGSGSGKTSLLNCMSGRMKGNRLSSTGRTLFNGRENASDVRSAYVGLKHAL
jgi:ABC-type glutathione transport system ATPase component